MIVIEPLFKILQSFHNWNMSNLAQLKLSHNSVVNFTPEKMTFTDISPNWYVENDPKKRFLAIIREKERKKRQKFDYLKKNSNKANTYS